LPIIEFEYPLSVDSNLRESSEDLIIVQVTSHRRYKEAFASLPTLHSEQSDFRFHRDLSGGFSQQPQAVRWKIHSCSVNTYMICDFRLWLLLAEHDLNPAEYNALFDRELERLLPRISNPDERNRLQAMLGMGWTNYIAGALRNGGFHDQADLQEKIHDVIVKLLVSPGGLFRNYDEARHGPFDLRWKRSVGNAVRNVAEKEATRRRRIPTVPIDQEFRMDVPDRASRETDEGVIEDFRRLVWNRLGQLGLGILDARLNGEETKSLVGQSGLGSPSHFAVKQMVQQIKTLAVEFGRQRGDPTFLWQITRALDKESQTVQKRQATATARKPVAVGG
jgi:hypothetical protein